MECSEKDNFIYRIKTSLLKYLDIRKQFVEKVIELVDVGEPNMQRRFKDGIIEQCNEVCGKMREGEAKEIHGG